MKKILFLALMSFFGLAQLGNAQDRKITVIQQDEIKIIDNKNFFFGGWGTPLLLIEIPEADQSIKLAENNFDLNFAVKTGLMLRGYSFYLSLSERTQEIEEISSDNLRFDFIKIQSYAFNFQSTEILIRHTLHFKYGLALSESSYKLYEEATRVKQKEGRASLFLASVGLNWYFSRSWFFSVDYSSSLGESSMKQNQLDFTVNFLYSLWP